ncbi:MAG TPA: protein kinase, partial [Fibrobacteria bacterium]|nr:protein kinase [Fibrobacteria bacterium]
MLPMLAEDRLIGTRIEKCVVERLIGRGGYGLTFLAFDEELQEHRVLKVSNAWAEDEEGKKRQIKSFIEEGLILSRLKHPQIVTLRGQGERHGHRYMVLDYIQGFSLKSVLDIVTTRRAELGCRWEELLDPAVATALVLSALEPLEYAHRANVHLPDREIFGVAHRDISPGNLILGVKGNEKGRVVLIDFGTAKTDLADTTTVNHHLVGTVPYMSKARLQKAATPEECAATQGFWRGYRETQNDIHALGVLYYQILTGRLPFPGETTPQIIVRVLDPESYSAIHREMAQAFPQVAAALRKCLVYFDFNQPPGDQPYQYPDASAMRADLEEVFELVSGGRSVQEILIDFSSKLSEPESMMPACTHADALQAESAVFELTNLPSPYGRSFEDLSPDPPPHRWILPAAALLLAAGVGGTWLLLTPDSRPTSTPMAALEPIEPTAPAAGAPTSRPKPRKRSGETQGTDQARSVAPVDSAHGSVIPASVQSLLSKVPHAAGSAAPETAGTGESREGLVWSKDAFVQLQTLVRQEDPEAFERIIDWLSREPESPDLLLLKCQLILKRNPASADARSILTGLTTARPAFQHPQVFHENALYLLWQTDAAIHETQKTPASRINLLKSANLYLAEFEPNAAYA